MSSNAVIDYIEPPDHWPQWMKDAHKTPIRDREHNPFDRALELQKAKADRLRANPWATNSETGATHSTKPSGFTRCDRQVETSWQLASVLPEGSAVCSRCMLALMQAVGQDRGE